MPDIERLTVTMPADMAATVRAAVEGGAYASTSEIVREALRDWTDKRDADRRALASLREMIDKGFEGEGRDADEVLADLDTLINEIEAEKG